MSVLRARCPDCRTNTAVAIDDGYECHACGATFAAGLVRVAGAWGTGGEAMVEAASLALRYPEAIVVRTSTLEEQTDAVASSLPARPLVLGGCCCAHIGAIRGLAGRSDDLAVVWIDAHGDLNTPETSPSGNLWGMPLRMAIDEQSVAPSRVALVAARSLDPPEIAYMEQHGIDDDVERVVHGADGVYVALDVDGLDPVEIACFMPEPGGPGVDEVAGLLRQIAATATVVGLGLTGATPATDPATLQRFVTAAGL